MGAKPALKITARNALAELNDEAVVAAHLSHDERAFAEIVRRYQTRLLNFVYRVIRDRERAEDLVQEAFMRAHKHMHRFDQEKKFSTWIYTIASNLSKNELRNRSRNPLVLFQALEKNKSLDDDRPLQFEDPKGDPEAMMHQRLLREVVNRAIEQLPYHHRAIFTLRELEGKEYEEIADITGLDLGTMKSRLNRARTAFANLVAPFVYELGVR